VFSKEKKAFIDQEIFDRFLVWLNPDRNIAAFKYEEIRIRLIKIFVHRGCMVAEELADETIDRVCRKVPEIDATYVGEPALYFYGVAHNVFLEYVRKKPDPLHLPPPDPPTEKELKYNCLERCLGHLDSESHMLISQYFEREKRSKINHRKKLAEDLGIAVTTLRMRAHRIKTTLQQCVIDCMKQNEPN
jgi:DNA-directed RNA polymerase specialized sigma24 family protein